VATEHNEGLAAAVHIVHSPDTTFKQSFLDLAAPYMDEARKNAQTTVIRYHGQAKKRREQELREELA
jgi:hypothetical protein